MDTNSISASSGIDASPNVVLEWVENMPATGTLDSNDNVITLSLEAIPVVVENQGSFPGEELENQLNETNNTEYHENIPPSIPSIEPRRKRQCNPSSWKCNIRKQQYQAGKEYVSRRGKRVVAKKVQKKKDCLKCKYKCSKLITAEEQQKIFDSFYTLNQDQKSQFILNTTEKVNKNRTYPKKEESRRQFSFKYFFDVHHNRFQVCKPFYLGTLSISQKPIYTIHRNKIQISNVPTASQRGKVNGRKLPKDAKENVMAHINTFPKVASHYCRADSKKEYLDSNLNIRKMYQLYLEKCEESQKEPVTESMYRHIFCTEFNLDFHKPKKDLCFVCEDYNLTIRNEKEIDDAKLNRVETHKEMKIKMREAKERDKASGVPILCFDLENVITLPKTNIGNFFYLQKLTCYNLTGHLSTTKNVYNAIWTEYISGRTGNDLASALTQILEKVLKDHEGITDIITWSDSCVPQNRNSNMAFAILTFLNNHPNVKSITMKYSVPGHSAIQEVDNVHSQIEKKKLRNNEIYSPIGLIRVLKTINNKFQFIQLKPEHFRDFATCSKTYAFKKIPFSKVVDIRYKQNTFEVEYKTDYDSDYQKVSIKNSSMKLCRKRVAKPEEVFPQPKISKKTPEISASKRDALQSMMSVMNEQARLFYKTILKIK